MNKSFASVLAMLLLLGLDCQARSDEVDRPYDNALGEIMYLVPADVSLVEEHFHPDALRAQDPNRIGATSYWERIELWQARGKLSALIVHHAAVDLVDETAVAHWYREENLILVGMGVSSDQFEAVGGRPFSMAYFWTESTDGPHHFVIASECRTHNGFRQSLGSDSIHYGGMLWFYEVLKTQLTQPCPTNR